MAQRTCTCGTVFTQRSNRHAYCSRACRPSEAVEASCQLCGQTFTKATLRWNAEFCSILCRNYSRDGILSSPLPRDHWGRWYGRASAWERKATAPISAPFRACLCGECGKRFLERAWSPAASRWCSETCSRRVHRRIRKAREHSAPGEFNLTDVIRQYIRQGSTCAYCHLPCEGLPDPEHVIPLSRGGDNSMSNIVAACRACNGDKRDLTPTEWATDRARRGLQPIDTSLSGPAFTHLALATPA